MIIIQAYSGTKKDVRLTLSVKGEVFKDLSTHCDWPVKKPLFVYKFTNQVVGKFKPLGGQNEGIGPVSQMLLTRFRLRLCHRLT